MSVMRRMEVALTYVTIQLVATSVSVRMAMSWTQINIHAMVLCIIKSLVLTQGLFHHRC